MPLQLVASAKKVSDTVDAASRAFRRELNQVYRDLTRKLGPLVQAAAQGSPTAIVQAAQAASLQRSLKAAMQEVGYVTLVDVATDDPLDRVARDVLRGRRIAGASASLTARAQQRLRALKALNLNDLLQEGDDVSRALWQATARGVFSSRSPERILADLADVLDDTEPHLATFYDTSLSIYGRQVEALQSGDDPEATFAYMGPIDSRTRDFCLKHAGKVLTRDEIDDLDNGQLDNVFLTGGGYNCRHIWMEVSQVSSLRDLVGTRSRVPEVQTQLDDLEEAA